MEDKLEGTLAEIRAEMGATGNFPDGKLGARDEGELKFAVARYQDQVLIVFGTPVEWLGLPREVAMQLSDLIIRKAQEIQPK